MCGRFSLSFRERERLAFELGVPVEQLADAAYRPRFNVAPTDGHWLVRQRYEDRQLLPAKWGLVNTWATDAKRAALQINARAETLARLPSFRDAFRRRRCVVPADGFFEWVGSGAGRQPVWFHRPAGGLILFAGLYESWQPEPEQWQRTFTIVTTEPNEVVAAVHDRMPVILPESAVDGWLDPRQENLDTLTRLLVPAAADVLVATAVSSRVNSVRNDDAACLEPSPPSPSRLL